MEVSEGRSVAEKNNMFFAETSAKNNKGITEFFDDLSIEVKK